MANLLIKLWSNPYSERVRIRSILDTYIEIVDLQELKQIHAHQLEAYAEMLAEDHVVVQVDHIHDVFGVILLQELQDFQLDPSLVVVLLLVLHDLDADLLLNLVVEAFYRRSERALPQEALDFVTIPNVVVSDYFVVAFVVIVAEVVLELAAALHFLSCRSSNEIDFRVVLDLLLLVVCELVLEVEQGLLWRHGELGHLECSFRRVVRLEGEGSADGVICVGRAVAVCPMVRNGLSVRGVGSEPYSSLL